MFYAIPPHLSPLYNPYRYCFCPFHHICLHSLHLYHCLWYYRLAMLFYVLLYYVLYTYYIIGVVKNIDFKVIVQRFNYIIINYHWRSVSLPVEFPLYLI